MTGMLSTLLVIVPLFFALPVVRAGGVIACLSGRLNGGVGSIPIHNPEVYDGTDTYVGGPFNTDCGQMVGRSSDGFTTWKGSNGRKITADFWITSDSCMNIMTGGQHHWCCTGGIKQGNGAVTQCNYT